MASFSLKNILVTVSMLALVVCNANAQLVNNFYGTSCPSVGTIVRNAMREAVTREVRMAASILRLFFHDCFVNGCDGSILLDDTATFTGEKNAFPNQNSVRGYEVVDTIKTRVEAACRATVSCADILALAARDAVFLTGGADWVVPLGRRDARTASQTAANNDLPPPTADLPDLLSSFEAKGLRLRDLVILSGAHTIGSAQCSSFRTRIYNETNIDPAFATARRAGCPSTGSDTNLAVFNGITPNRFDNSYYINLQNRRGLLHSDQALLFQNGSTAGALIRFYSNNAADFQEDFAAAMVKLGNISPLTGTNGEIRRNCRVPN